MPYARARLRLGITSVGTLVVSAAAAVVFDLPHRFLPTAATAVGSATELAALAATFAVYLAVSFPFDLRGGHVLPRRYGRSSASLAKWFACWARGVAIQAVVWIGLAFAVLQTSRAIAPWAGFALVVVASLALVAAQGTFARWIGGLRTQPGEVPVEGPARDLLNGQRVTAVAHEDVGFTGGWVGWPGRETLLVPELWIERLGRETLQAELVRRALVLSRGARTRGLAIALAFDLVGFALAAFVLGGSLTTVAGIVEVAAWVTLWSFAGALVLPSLSRPAVYGADRDALAHGVDRDTLSAAARQLDRWQDDEPRRPRGVETVFHPIPAVEHRIEALGEPGRAGSGAWHTARAALWLSWASLGLLGRAVHCNCGRTELWVLLPAD